MRFIPPGSSYSNISLPRGPAQCGLHDWGLAMNHPSREVRHTGALVHTPVTPTFYLRSWAPALQTHQDHPLVPDRQLAPSPVYSSPGRTTILQGKQPWARAEGLAGTLWGHQHRVCPWPGQAQASMWPGWRGWHRGRSLFTWWNQGAWPVHPVSSWAGNLIG